MTTRKRLLVIVNPNASTVSARLKNLVVHALAGKYEVDARDTEAQNHATELCREAAASGNYDAVVAFGGDGTVNEVANGLANTDLPMACLPGGATNVLCRLIHVPNDIVTASEQLLSLSENWVPRKIDLGKVHDRYFTFSSGVGFDAQVVAVADHRSHLKAKYGAWWFTAATLTAFAQSWIGSPPRIRADAQGTIEEGVAVVVQNGPVYTFFNDLSFTISENAELGSGTLSGITLKRMNPLDIPTFGARMFARKRLRFTEHNQVTSFSGVTNVVCQATGEKPFPIHVDGDYIGRFSTATYTIEPEALSIISPHS